MVPGQGGAKNVNHYLKQSKLICVYTHVFGVLQFGVPVGKGIHKVYDKRRAGCVDKTA